MGRVVSTFVVDPSVFEYAWWGGASRLGAAQWKNIIVLKRSNEWQYVGTKYGYKSSIIYDVNNNNIIG